MHPHNNSLFTLFPVLLTASGTVCSYTLVLVSLLIMFPLYFLGNVRAIKMLLDHGALLNKRDHSGVNALWWATQYGMLKPCLFFVCQDDPWAL